MKRGKKYVEAAKAVNRGTLYDVADAVSLVKKTAVAKFDETIEAHIRTGCDGRHADQQIRGAVVLPHGTGKKVRILVFAKDAKAEEAKAAGADYVGGDELIPKIQNENWFEFDVVVATPDMMGVVGRLGRVLGPKGLMPNPKAGTVTMDVTKAIQDIKAGKIEYRLDKSNIIQVPIGKVSFTEEKLQDNFNALMEAMALGLPIVATDCPCGGPATLIRDEENGLLVPIKNAEAMAAGINRLIENPELAEKLGRNARRITEYANAKAVCGQWKDYIEEVCHK